jgi:hypothetical protein
LKVQAKVDPSKAEELKNIQQEKRQLTKRSKGGSPHEASMADSNQGDTVPGGQEQQIMI